MTALYRRLQKTPEKLKQYDEIIKLQEKEGIIEAVDPNQIGGRHYIPHREVVKGDRKSTKMRIVYDASAKRSGQPSLNDCLKTGPCLLPKIFDVVVRFRCYKYPLVSDIKSAFLNIRIAKEDRDHLRFL